MKINILAAVAALAIATPSIAYHSDKSTGAMPRPQTGLSAQEYVMKAADGDMYEIESSRVALAKSQTPGVRAHAQQMITDHTKTSTDLKNAIARSKSPGLEVPAMMTPAKQAMVAELQGADARDFDKKYVAQQLMAHQEAWAVHQGYGQSGQDPVLKAAAKKTVPIVKGHLNHLKMMKTM